MPKRKKAKQTQFSSAVVQEVAHQDGATVTPTLEDLDATPAENARPRKKKGMRRAGGKKKQSSTGSQQVNQRDGAKAHPASVDTASFSLEEQREDASRLKGRSKKRKRSVLTTTSSTANGKQADIQESRTEAKIQVVGVPALNRWLHQSKTLEAVEVRNDGNHTGLGVFALRSLAIGEVAFAVPCEMLLTPQVAAEDSLVHAMLDVLQISEDEGRDFGMCLRLCIARSSSDDPFWAYVSNLPEAPPGCAFWPDAFREVIATSHLAPQLAIADAELDSWEELLDRVSKANPKLVASRCKLFERSSLRWARGMLHCHRLAGKLEGFVPLLSLLPCRGSGNSTVRIRDGFVECVCERAVKAGEQIHTSLGIGNVELLVSHGLAIEDDPAECVSLPLVYTEEKCKADVKTLIRLTGKGIPQDVVDKIEDEQNTHFFIALLQGVIRLRRELRSCAQKLPQALNFNVCKGPVARARKRSIEIFLEGQLRVLDFCLEEMQTCRDDDEKDAAHSREEALQESEEEEAEDEEQDIKSWKRRRRK